MILKPIEDRIREVLGEHYGSTFQSVLEIQYENKMITKLMEDSYETKEEWATFNQVVLELKNNLNEYHLVKELQYRLSDYESPRTACIEVIENSKSVSPELQRLYEKIQNFKG